MLNLRTRLFESPALLATRVESRAYAVIGARERQKTESQKGRKADQQGAEGRVSSLKARCPRRKRVVAEGGWNLPPSAVKKT